MSFFEPPQVIETEVFAEVPERYRKKAPEGDGGVRGRRPRNPPAPSGAFLR